MNSVLTYRDLKDWLSTLTDDELSQRISVTVPGDQRELFVWETSSPSIVRRALRLFGVWSRA